MPKIVRFKQMGRAGREGGTIVIDVTCIESASSWSDGNERGTHIIMDSGVNHYVDADYMKVYEAIELAYKEQLPTPTELTPIPMRDYFAAAALPALIDKFGKTAVVTIWAYEVADSMLDAREQKEGGEG